MKNRLLCTFTLICFLVINKSRAQLPVCDIVYGRYGYDSIANYNPTLGPSTTNPSVNSIGTPLGTSGLTIGPVLGSGSPVRTFYTVDLATNNYIYYNPSTSTWINTGHKCGTGVNIAAGGGYIFNLDGPSGKVYRYDGTGDATLLTTVSAFVGGAPYDLIADCEGSWYIFNQTGSSPFLAQYSSGGTLVKTWVYSNPLGLSVRAAGGFAIIGDSVYTDDNYIAGGGAIATYVLGFDTLTLVKTSRIDKVVSNDLASCEGAAFAHPIIEIKESVNDICFTSPVSFTSKSLGGGASPGYKWFVNGVFKSTGTTYTYTPVSGDKVYCVLTSSSSCAITATDTSNVIIMNTPGPKVTNPIDLCLGGASAPLTAIGSGLKWYTSASGGTGSATAPTPSTATAATTTYYVSQNCPAPVFESPRSVINVIVHPLPAISFSTFPATSMTLCRSSPLTLKAFNPIAVAWQWDSMGIVLPAATKDSLVVYTKGKWGVTLKDIYGCQNRVEADVNKDTTALPVLSPTEAFICEEGSVLLTCSPGFLSYTFEWLKDALPLSSPSPMINLWNANLAGTYSVKVTNTLGCADTSNKVLVSYYPKPLKPLIVNKDPVLEIPPAYLFYQWYKDGLKIVGSTSNALLTTKTGMYHVEVTDGNGCTNQSDTVAIDQSSSITSSVLSSYVDIYPNPARDKVFILAPDNTFISVEDIFGKQIFSGNNLSSIDMSIFASGIYIFKVFSNEHQLFGVVKIYKSE